jgi:membrane protein YqaA with SNARE-associated domain
MQEDLSVKMSELHHFYVGLGSVVLAWVAVFRVGGVLGSTAAWAFGLFGLWLIADDLFQHYRQREHLLYRSPAHRIWAWLLRKIK